MSYIGIDLGTSAVKLLLVDGDGSILNSVSKEYPIEFPQLGWSQQNPEDWVEAVKSGLREVIANRNPKEVDGIGLGGQMHGLVVLNQWDEVIRPAILWNDGRTEKEVEYLNREIGEEKLLECTGNIAFAGFTAPKILWMKHNEPERFARIDKIMLPKDYVNYYLTGIFATDYSDAAGTLLLDVRHKVWSKEMLKICGIKESQLPPLYASYEQIGVVKAELVEQLGLRENVIVVAGAADNAAAAVGTGTVGAGTCNISLGTSGTIFIPCEDFDLQSGKKLHTFIHADMEYHLLGCILSAASCNKWFMEEILEDNDFAGTQNRISEDNLGKNNIYFLPYLMGERSPINDTNASGTFIGLRMSHKKADMLQAVLEGVCFALRDCVEVAREQGISISRSTICGGGAKSRLWRKMLSNILQIPLEVLITEEGPGYGAAMLAAVACGTFADIEQCKENWIKVAERVEPDSRLVALYEERYQRYRKIYPALREVYGQIQ